MNTIFQRTVVNTWGRAGQVWLSRLPMFIEELSSHWQLDDIQPVKNMSYHYVALARQASQTPVVLKIGCDPQLTFDEYCALKHFDGQGAVRILDINKKYNALLLERAIPGDTLKALYPDNLDVVIDAYAKLVKMLERPLGNRSGYTHVNQWCQSIDRIEDSRVEYCFIEKAQSIRSLLLASSQHEYLCHGDLHLDNVLQHKDECLAIDPKGIIGERAFEAAAFDIIAENEMQNLQAMPSKIINRISQLAVALDLPVDRLLQWTFLRVMISAQWFIEDDGDPSKMLLLAKCLYSNF